MNLRRRLYLAAAVGAGPPFHAITSLWVAPSLSLTVLERQGGDVPPVSSMLPLMPWRLKRYQQARCLHFITFSCYRREPLLGRASARETFEAELERVGAGPSFRAQKELGVAPPLSLTVLERQGGDSAAPGLERLPAFLQQS